MKVSDKMNDKKALEIINKIFNNVFNQENLFTLEELFKNLPLISNFLNKC